MNSGREIRPFCLGGVSLIYFDNAATTGVKPPQVIQGVGYALKNYCANPGRSGHPASQAVAEAVFKTRTAISDFFGSDGPETVVFTQNCTHSVNCVLKGLLKRGDHCIISSLEHNAVVRPLVKTGVSYSVARVYFDDDEKTLKSFEEQIKPNTKLIFCMGASNVWGKILPLTAIGQLCCKRGIYFGVDGAQLGGIAPINMTEQHIDFLCLAPHKGLYAPMGIGVLIARRPLPFTVIEGGTGTNSMELYQPEFLPERLESGTVNIPGIIGTLKGLEFIKQKGIGKMYSAEMELLKRLYRGLERLDFIELYTPYPQEGEFVPVLSFNFKGHSSEEIATLYANEGIALRGGLHCAPFSHRQTDTSDRGAIRISLGVFNTKKETEDFLKKTLEIYKKITKKY